MTKRELVEFYQLIIASLEGTISKEQSVLLIQKLRTDEEAAGYYVDFLSIYTNLYSPGLSDTVFEREESACEALTNYDSDIWKLLLETEKTAPSVIFPKEIAPIEEPLKTGRVPKKINKLSLFTAIAASAALILMVLFPRFSAPQHNLKIATLMDSIDAKWAEGLDIRIGSRFLTHSGPVQLQRGVAKISYDQGVDLILEGPAEVEFISPLECLLNYGKAYARVSEQGMGFTIATSNSRVIDLGTEFGVLKNFDGSTEVHVIKGKTSLLSGSAAQDKKSQVVCQGQARQIRPSTSRVVDIAIDTKNFIRDISSQKKFVWRGEPVNLASLVMGENGFVTNDAKMGIDPAAGRINPETIQDYNRSGTGYHRFSGRSAVDGVFVPDGGAGANVVTSTGIMFDAFPDTDGYYWSDITAWPYIWESIHDQVPQCINIVLKPADSSKPAFLSYLLVHSNAGITFDLNKIRQSFPHRDITRFRATCGISQNVTDKKQSSFWVLLDGKCVFRYDINDKNMASKEIDLPIDPQQQFLTLAATDGGDQIIYDWCVFADPVLELVSE